MLHTCEAIVDAATWRLANESLDARPKRGKVFAKDRAMLATALFCPVCEDSPMYRIKSGKGNTHLYYRCSGRGPQRKGCGLMVDAAEVDDAADQAMSMLNEERMQRVPVPRPDYEADLAQVGYAKQQLLMQGLSRADEDAGLARLRAEEDAIIAGIEEADKLPPYRDEPTGESYAEIWVALPVYERGPWLTRERLYLTASHKVVKVHSAAKGAWQRRESIASAPIRRATI